MRVKFLLAKRLERCYRSPVASIARTRGVLLIDSAVRVCVSCISVSKGALIDLEDECTTRQCEKQDEPQRRDTRTLIYVCACCIYVCVYYVRGWNGAGENGVAARATLVHVQQISRELERITRGLFSFAWRQNSASTSGDTLPTSSLLLGRYHRGLLGSLS